MIANNNPPVAEVYALNKVLEGWQGKKCRFHPGTFFSDRTPSNFLKGVHFRVTYSSASCTLNDSLALITSSAMRPEIGA